MIDRDKTGPATYSCKSDPQMPHQCTRIFTHPSAGLSGTRTSSTRTSWRPAIRRPSCWTDAPNLRCSRLCLHRNCGDDAGHAGALVHAGMAFVQQGNRMNHASEHSARGRATQGAGYAAVQCGVASGAGAVNRWPRAFIVAIQQDAGDGPASCGPPA